jgi:hypothetical protein
MSSSESYYSKPIHNLEDLKRGELTDIKDENTEKENTNEDEIQSNAMQIELSEPNTGE